MTRAPAAALAALMTVSCHAPLMPLMSLPPGPGVPAADGEQALLTATAVCGAVSTFSAEIGVAGSVSGRRIPRGHLIVALGAVASARIEAPAPFGSPIFVFVARDDDAQLLLERDNRVLEHGRPDAVLEALTGVPLDVAGLRTTLTGCAVAPDWHRARQLGDDWMTMPDGTGELYLRRGPHAGPWQIAAAIHYDAAGAEWHAEYRGRQDGLPRSIRLAASDRGRFDLALSLSQVDVNAPFGADVFRIRIPSAATPITLDELNGLGPLGDRGSNAR
jgi:hypothetical protein